MEKRIVAFGTKLLASFRRVADLFRLFPLRLIRLVEHSQNGLKFFDQQVRKATSRKNVWPGILRWWTDFLFFLLELLGLPEIYEFLSDWLKFNTRQLYDWEKDLAKSVFGNSIKYHRVRVDEKALIGPRQYRLCYVSGNTINSWGGMPNSLLIHELMHVWQFQNLGLAYIPRALRAQFTKAGYNYGGIAQLRRYRQQGKTLFDFNYEQQADIIADFYRLREGYKPQWGNGSISDLSTYEYFLKFLHV